VCVGPPRHRRDHVNAPDDFPSEKSRFCKTRSKDYERLTSTEETFIYLVGIRLLLTRLAPD
jgi:hypothetical protein